MERILRSLLVSATFLAFCSELAFAQQPNAPPCPISQLAPYGLAPDSHCAGTGCGLSFANYKWWTAFTYNPNGGWYYNGGLGTTFAPEHVSVAADGLHLRMTKDWNGGKEWAGAEAVLMFNGDGKQANLGYGDYLIAAKLLSPGGANWNNYDPNVATGVFNYERFGNPVQCRGGNNNCAREVDLAEISRWGWNHQSPPNCPFSGSIGAFDKATLCQGSAQFALQDYTKASEMVSRYDVEGDANTKTITLVMRWRKGEVNFAQYVGQHSLSDLPHVYPHTSWTTQDSLSPFIPDTGAPNAPACQRFHLNLWLGNYLNSGPNAPHPGPTNGQPVEIVIRSFEFKPAP
jgi:hypothetical protein